MPAKAAAGAIVSAIALAAGVVLYAPLTMSPPAARSTPRFSAPTPFPAPPTTGVDLRAGPSEPPAPPPQVAGAHPRDRATARVAGPARVPLAGRPVSWIVGTGQPPLPERAAVVAAADLLPARPHVSLDDPGSRELSARNRAEGAVTGAMKTAGRSVAGAFATAGRSIGAGLQKAF